MRGGEVAGANRYIPGKSHRVTIFAVAGVSSACSQ